MAVKTQGTDLYVIDPQDGSVISVACVTNISGLDSQLDQIETTCLSETARTYMAGLAAPGTATFGVRFDLNEASHFRLLQLKMAGTTLRWAVGWSQDPGAAPTSQPDSSGAYDFVTGGTRSWLLFDGYISSWPSDFQQNSTVESTVGIQISGDILPVPMVP